MLTEYAKRMAAEPWRRWYKTAHWQRLRTIVLNRDPVCMICHRYASTVADHKKPHKGVWIMFCDLANLWGLCAHCHNEKTAREDGGFGNVPKAANGKATQHSVDDSVIDAALDDLADVAALDV